jgi:hypothetical protein
MAGKIFNKLSIIRKDVISDKNNERITDIKL